MFKLMIRILKLKIKIFLLLSFLFLAADVSAQVWGDAPQTIKRGRRVIGISNLIGETESTDRQCIPSGKFIGYVVKRNLNAPRRIISSFVIRRERNERIAIYLSETLNQRLAKPQLQLVRRLLNAKRKIEVGMNRCRATDGSLSFAISIEEL